MLCSGRFILVESVIPTSHSFKQLQKFSINHVFFYAQGARKGGVDSKTFISWRNELVFSPSFQLLAEAIFCKPIYKGKGYQLLLFCCKALTFLYLWCSWPQEHLSSIKAIQRIQLGSFSYLWGHTMTSLHNRVCRINIYKNVGFFLQKCQKITMVSNYEHIGDISASQTSMQLFNMWNWFGSTSIFKCCMWSIVRCLWKSVGNTGSLLVF